MRYTKHANARPRRGVRVAGAAIAVAALLPACGDDGSTTAAATTTTASAASTGSTAASASGAPTTIASKAASMEPCPALKGIKVGYSKATPNPAFGVMEGALKTELEPLGMTVSSTNANASAVQQLSDVQSLLQSGVKVLVVSALDANALTDVYKKAHDDGVILVPIDSPVDNPIFATVARGDYEEAGRANARLLKQLVGDGGVGFVQAPPTNPVLSAVEKAFYDEAKKVGLTILDGQINQTLTADAAQQIGIGWKQRFGKKMVGIGTMSDVTSIALASLKDDSFNPVIASINANADAIPLIKDGKITASQDGNPELEGRAAAFGIVNAICGRTLPRVIWSPVTQYTKDNVSAWVPPTDRVKRTGQLSIEQKDGRSVIKFEPKS